jgi:predicted AlkP superfamily pyrophosphatase or phosphodiesterase
MPALHFVGLLLCCLCAAPCASAQSLLLISIDGLHPDYVLKADQYGLRLSQLRRFVSDGSFANGVRGVIPTVTYPSHTTLVTGVAPAEHGIVSNTTFDPTGRNRDGWYWYAEDIKVQTLWHAAAQAGLKTAAVNWPVTVADVNIQFLLPEYWRASTTDDGKLLRALSRPSGLLQEMERTLGPFIDGNIDTLDADRARTRFAVELIDKHKPELIGVHLIALDGIQHADGPQVPSVYATLEQIDAMVGELVSVMRKSDPDAVVAVVSDHGFIATHTAVNLRTSFVKAGLITLKPTQASSGLPMIESWEAQVWSGGASGAVVLRDRADTRTRKRVEKLLRDLASDTRNGIARVMSKDEYADAGAFPGSDFLIEFAPGFYLGTSLEGDLLAPASSKGTHGYLPERPEMYASLFVQGKGIAPGRELGIVDMRQVAPTLAAILGTRFVGATLPPLYVFEEATQQSKR